MRIGCPTEIKPQEFRVGLTPNAALEAVSHGHEVLIQSGAGNGAGFTDKDYETAGAEIVSTAEEIFSKLKLLNPSGKSALKTTTVNNHPSFHTEEFSAVLYGKYVVGLWGSVPDKLWQKWMEDIIIKIN